MPKRKIRSNASIVAKNIKDANRILKAHSRKAPKTVRVAPHILLEKEYWKRGD
jgi:hypothetical protein